MNNLPALISDLALILVSAGLITLLFKWLKQPLVLGYVVAGILAGPHFVYLPSVQDVASIDVWAEIGVVFLLFALGLEFSFKKLMNVGGTAGITAITEVICMMLIGFTAGQILGWSIMDSVLLGGMLTISSTTIIIKTFDELGLRSQKFTGIVFGVLVVEDLVAILMMVLVSTVAAAKFIDGEAIMGSVLKLAFFLVLWFVTGIFLLPAFFRKVRRLMNDETLLIISLGLCLGMVVMATGTGFSAALGAFIMGSVMAETVEAEHIEHIVRPVKDLFGAIFFVSVGMLIDPHVIANNALPVLFITLVAILGKTTAASLGVLLSGQPLKTSLQAGFSLGQIGEFAFIIAGLGVSLKVVSGFIYPIIVAVSVLTIFASPYVIQLSTPFFNWLEKVLPNNFKSFLDRYASGGNTINHDTDWEKLIKKFMTKIMIHSVLLTAIFLLTIHFIHPAIDDCFDNGTLVELVTSVIALLLMFPFLTALLLKKFNSPDLFMSLWNDSKYNRGRLVSLVVMRIVIAIFFVSLLLAQVFQASTVISLLFALAVTAVVFRFRGVFNLYSRIEKRFLHNYNERESIEESKISDLNRNFTVQLQERDIHLSTVIVSPDSPFVGKMLSELELRKNHGVNIVKIFRGATRINIPSGKELIFPYDKLTLAGTNVQLEEIAKLLELQHPENALKNEIKLVSFTVDNTFYLLGQVVACSHQQFKCLVVGMERDKKSFYPEASHCFELGDLVWIVGEPINVQRLVKG